MAQKPVESKVGELVPANGTNSVLASQEKQLPGALKKIPLKDLHSENNIIAKKNVGNLVVKEAVITEAAKVSGTKRPSTDSQMSPSLQHSPSGSGANGHLVYVRRKPEAEAGKNNHNEVVADNSNPPHQLSIRCGKPSIPVFAGNLNNRKTSDEPQTQPVVTAITSSGHRRVNKHNWEERYLQLQMVLKTLDHSSLEDHLQRLRSLSAVELSRHAVELEKRAIQLSLEQGKELQRVKALNVLGKSMRTPSCTGPPVQQQMPQN